MPSGTIFQILAYDILPNSDHGTSRSARRDLQLYAWLTASAPQIVDDIRQNGPDRLEEISQLVRPSPTHSRILLTFWQLDKGRTGVRGTDIHGIKDAIASWRVWSPPIFEDNKDLRGFNHDEIAALLANDKIDLSDAA